MGELFVFVGNKTITFDIGLEDDNNENWGFSRTADNRLIRTSRASSKSGSCSNSLGNVKASRNEMIEFCGELADHGVRLRARYSFPALISKPMVFLTRSIRDFFHVSHPSGRCLSTNIAFRSSTATAGSPPTCLAPGLLARKAKSRPNSPADPTRLSSPRS